MHLTWVSFVSRISAAALAFQSGAPIALSIKESLDSPKRTVSKKQQQPKLPSMPRPKPFVHPINPNELKPAPEGAPARPIHNSPTLLDERAYLRGSVTGYDAESWRKELLTHPRPEREARLRIQIGEFELGNSEPLRAQYHFRKAIALVPASNPDRGLASYDEALSLFLQGRFSAARHEFRRIFKGPLTGFNRKNAAMYAKHASACASYHSSHEALGIPEPDHLDPLCGAAALAVSMRKLGLRYDLNYVSSRVKHTGEGSSFEDLLEALPKLGLSGQIVKADKQGLIASPVPLIAFVERDHFVTVVDADKDGIEYVCSDCGAWPGGPVRLNWKQWKAMDASIYIAVARANTPQAMALSHLPATMGGKSGRIDLASLKTNDLGAVSAAQRILTSVAGHVALIQTNPYHHNIPAYCGMRGTSLHCSFEPCPDHCITASPFSSFAGDPVNLATGEEEYAPAPDITVYNPKGPSVVWSRTFNSLANTVPNGFGVGWSHNYNWRIERVLSGSTYRTDLVMPNSARLTITQNEAAPPTSSNPVRPANFGPGIPMKLEWRYDATSSKKYYVVIFKDNSKWTFGLETSTAFGPIAVGGTSGYFYVPTKIEDRSGGYLSLTWGNQSFPNHWDITTGLTSAMALQSIGNADGELFRIHYTTISGGIGGGIDYVAEVSPDTTTTRGIRYQVDRYSNGNVGPNYPQYSDELTNVTFFRTVTRSGSSLTVAAYTPGFQERYKYNYSSLSNLEASETVPYLTSITVPATNATYAGNEWIGEWNHVGVATTTLSYSSDGSVSSIVDANGNTTTFTPVLDGSGNAIKTKVSVANSSGVKSLVYYAYFNNQMVGNRMDYVAAGAGTGSETLFTPATATFSDATSPWKPTSITDGGSRTWNMTWNPFGSLLTWTSPKGLTTTNTYNPTFFGQEDSTTTSGRTPITYHYRPGSGIIESIDTAQPYNTGVVAGSIQTTSYGVPTSLGNFTTVSEPGNPTLGLRTSTYGYGGDGFGERLGLVTSITDATNHADTYAYDYRGNLITSIDRDGNRTDNQYNAADQVVQVTHPASGQNGTNRSYTQYLYEYVGGPLTRIQTYAETGSPRTLASETRIYYGIEGESYINQGDSERSATLYDSSYRPVQIFSGTPNSGYTITYDTAGRVIREACPNAASTNGAYTKNYTYDSSGRLKTVLNGRNIQKTLSYADGDGKLTGVAYTSGGSLTQDAAGAWYLVGGTTALSPATGAGYNVTIHYDVFDLVDQIDDAMSSTTYSYDDLGNTKAENRHYGPFSTKSTLYYYNPDNSKAAMTLGGYSWNYSYDSLGRYSSMTVNQGATTIASSSASYTNGGSVLSTILPIGYTYNARKIGSGATSAGVLDGVYNETLGGSAYSTYTSMSYDEQHRFSSNVATVPVSTPLSGSTSYTYSNPANSSNPAPSVLLRELSGRNGGFDYNHTYDSGINPTKLRNVTQPSPYRGDDVPTGTGAASYDNDGNYGTNFGVSYDAENNMVVGPIASWGAGYRADGRRAWKSTGGVMTYYFYDEDGNVILETDISGNAKALNVFSPEGLVGRKNVTSGSMSYYLFDPQGNVAHEIDSGGTVLNSRAYDAYGQEVSVRNGSTTTTASDPFGFNAKSGYYYDRELGTYRCQLRDYAPGLGRWLERDPIGFAGGMNVYSYCAGQPVGNIDPSGLLVAGAAVVTAGALDVGGVAAAGAAGLTIVGAGILAAGAGATIGQAADDATGNAFSKWVLRVLGKEAPDILPPDPRIPRRRRRNGPKFVVIGQTMTRVIECATFTGADYYKGYKFWDQKPERGWASNAAWLRYHVDRGDIFLDISWDDRVPRGGSYVEEDKWLKAHGNPRRIKFPWPPSLPPLGF